MLGGVLFHELVEATHVAAATRARSTKVTALTDVLRRYGSRPHAGKVRRIVTASAIEASDFLDGALAAGHEGVMVKALDAPYEAGRRGKSWLKVKPVRTFDLVVLAAEWGHGRRRGWLSNLHLGAADPTSGP